MTDQNPMAEWDNPVEEAPLTLEAMDALITELRRARETYDSAKKFSTEKHNELEEIEKRVMGALAANGKSKYEAEGVGLVYLVEKEVYTTPKTNEEKRLLFQYIKDKYGNDSLSSMLGINYATLNSWANKEVESGVMKIPGLAQPTMATTLNFRKK